MIASASAPAAADAFSHPPACAARRLQLTGFRNLTDRRLDLPSGPVVLYGDNGAGKTNMLEAVSMLAPGRGLRRRLTGQTVGGGRSDRGGPDSAATPQAATRYRGTDSRRPRTFS